MKKLAQTLGLCLFMTLSATAQKNYVSEVWVADQGNGTYKNPILYADYSDPDACRVGDDFYMTSSSFNCLPGLQILHSKDLVNWTIIGAAAQNMAIACGHRPSVIITESSTSSGEIPIKAHSW